MSEDRIQKELLRDPDAPQQRPAAIELEDGRTVFVGDEEGPENADRYRLRIEPPRRAWLGRIERIRVANEVPVLFVPQEPGVEQRGPEVGERRGRPVDRDVQYVNAIEIGNVGAAVERPAIGDGQEQVAEARVGDAGSQAAERGLVDTHGRIVALANLLACQTGKVLRAAGDAAHPDQAHARVRGRQAHCRPENHRTSPANQLLFMCRSVFCWFWMECGGENIGAVQTAFDNHMTTA